MKAKEKVRKANLTQWSTKFQDQASSGLTVKEWCSQNNVSVYAFYYWKRIAKEAYVDSIIPDIVPVASSLPAFSETSIDTPQQLPDSRDLYNFSKSTSHDTITISVGDTRIEIGSSASDEMILAIVKAVRYA